MTISIKSVLLITLMIFAVMLTGIASAHTDETPALTAPTAKITSANPGSVNHFTIQVTVDENHKDGTITLWTDSGCTSHWTNTGINSTTDVTVPDSGSVSLKITVPKFNEKYTFYVSHTDGADTVCADKSVTYSYTLLKPQPKEKKSTYRNKSKGIPCCWFKWQSAVAGTILPYTWMTPAKKVEENTAEVSVADVLNQLLQRMDSIEQRLDQ